VRETDGYTKEKQYERKKLKERHRYCIQESEKKEIRTETDRQSEEMLRDKTSKGDM
jgi:hypothetical protein